VRKEQATADKAYDIQANVMQQQVVVEQVKIERAQREEQIKVQDAEIQRRERELIATVLKPAEVERQRIETIADAERRRRVLEAEGAADAAKAQGVGTAEATRAVGQAEAEIIRAKGQAEADAMHLRADAFRQYNQAAIIDKLLSNLPEIARAMSEPLSKVDKITIVSTGGDGKGFGANQITADIARMVAQVPELFETLTGVKVSDLMSKVSGLDGPASTNGNVLPASVALSDNGTKTIVDGTSSPPSGEDHRPQS
jgi:flotillin